VFVQRTYGLVANVPKVFLSKATVPGENSQSSCGIEGLVRRRTAVYGSLMSALPAGAGQSHLALLWPHRWRLLVATVLALVPALFANVLIDAISTGGAATIVNGAVVTLGPDGPGAALGVVLLVLGWSVAIAGGAVIAVGGLRGISIGPIQALRVTLRRLPTVVMHVVVLAVVGLILAIAVSMISSVGGVIGVVFFLAGLVAVGVLACRILLGLPRVILEPDAPVAFLLSFTKGRVVQTAGVLLAVGFLAPWLATVVLSAIGSAIARNVVIDGAAWTVPAAIALAVGQVWLVAVVTFQSAVLAVVYLRPRMGSVSAADVNVGHVDAQLRTIAGLASPAPLRGLVALLAVPALLSAGIALWNPYGAVHVHAYPGQSLSDVRHVGWPEGRPPVLASGHVIYDCVDEACRNVEWRLGQENWMPWDDGASIDAQGNLIAANAIGDDIDVQHCALDGTCRRATVPLPNTHQGLPQPLVAVASGHEDELWLAVATDLTEHVDDEVDTGDQPAEVEVALIRCTDWTCSDQRWTELGTVQAWLDDDLDPFGDPWLERWDAEWGIEWDAEWEIRDDHQEAPRLSVHVDGDGHPVVGFRNAHELWLGSCEPPTCTSPQLERHFSLGRSTIALGGVSDGGLGWTVDGQLRRCADEMCADGWLPDVPPGRVLGPGAVQVTRHGLFAVVAQPEAEVGLHLSIGDGADLPQRWLTLLVHCGDLLCASPQRYPLGYVDDYARGAVLLVHDDGRVVVRQSTSTGGTSMTLRMPDS
jgi:hypothetical protein